MTAMMIACCLTAFVVGGIPFGYLVGHLILKDDIRKHGSGNIGATNVARVIGWKWGSIVLILDAIKGLSPTLAAKMLLSSRPDCSPNFVLFATIATGIAAILGHMYPVWLRLRGGKGVATARSSWAFPDCRGYHENCGDGFHCGLNWFRRNAAHDTRTKRL